MKIWALDDGIPGHWSMTEGLIRLIGRARAVETERIAVEWRWGAARQLFQRCERLGLPVPAWCVRLATRLRLPAGGAPDLLVSRGGATLFLNAWVARRTGCANIFIGTLRRMPERLFRAVLLYQHDRAGEPYYPLPLFPTRIDPDNLEQSVQGFSWSASAPPEVGRVACLFLGGDGSGYTYGVTDWRRLAEGALRLHVRYGWRWCVASSRRTPPEAEAVFRELLTGEALVEACWWHAGDRRSCMDAFLGVAHTAFCTEDSMSMLEECIAAGRPLVSLGGEVGTPNSFFNSFLAQRVETGRMLRVSIGDFAESLPVPLPMEWRLVGGQEMQLAVCGMLERLDL